jgi:molecular chaperone GrpE
VLTDILPTIDNIERALQIEGDDESFKSLKKGVQMIHLLMLLISFHESFERLF